VPRGTHPAVRVRRSMCQLGQAMHTPALPPAGERTDRQYHQS